MEKRQRKVKLPTTHCSPHYPLILNVKQGSYATVLVANALCRRPLIGCSLETLIGDLAVNNRSQQKQRGVLINLERLPEMKSQLSSLEELFSRIRNRLVLEIPPKSLLVPVMVKLNTAKGPAWSSHLSGKLIIFRFLGEASTEKFLHIVYPYLNMFFFVDASQFVESLRIYFKRFGMEQHFDFHEFRQNFLSKIKTFLLNLVCALALVRTLT